MKYFHLIPAVLQQLSQWVCWRYATRGGIETKVPYSIHTGKPASVTNPEDWCSFADAVAESGNYDGVGFVFSETDGYVGIDLDACLDATEGLTLWAEELLTEVLGPGCYAEISPSGTGVKLIGRGKLPDDFRHVYRLPDSMQRYGDKQPEIAVYDQGRYFCLTGNCYDEPPQQLAQVNLKGLARFAESLMQPDKSTQQLGSFVQPKYQATTDAVARALARMGSVPVQDGNDGSKRLYIYASICCDCGCTPGETVTAIRRMEAAAPFPRVWSDAQILRRYQDASKAAGVPVQLPGEPLPAEPTADTPADDEPSEELSEPLRVGWFSDIEAKPVNWLWPGRIPFGCLTLLAGRGGVGKSYFTTWLAATVSQGYRFCDGQESQQAGTLFICAEDDPHRVVRPRLDLADADVTTVGWLYGVPIGQTLHPWEMQFTHRLGMWLDNNPQVSLIVIDPLGAHLGRIDSYSDSNIRTLLGPLANMLQDRPVACLVCAHLRKRQGGEISSESVMGSVGFVNAARAVWHLEPDPDDVDRKLLLPGKSNFPLEMGLAFHLSADGIDWEPDPVDLTADELAAEKPTRDRNTPSKLDQATRWLQQRESGVMPAGHLIALAAADGIAEKTLQRAATELGVKKEGGYWEMPW